jgi:hypothetical protein
MPDKRERDKQGVLEENQEQELEADLKPRYTCEVCHKDVVHLPMHTGENKFECEVCAPSACVVKSRGPHKQIHNRVYTGDQPNVEVSQGLRHADEDAVSTPSIFREAVCVPGVRQELFS